MENLIYKKEGPIARIIFDRPKSLNALTPQMLLHLKSLLEELKVDDDIKVIVVSGKGRAFSAGVDIKATDSDGFQESSDFMQTGMEIDKLFSSMPKVTIAQVHGYCFTGALELMLFMDMAFCTEETQFGDTHSKWAVIPRWGMTQRLSRRVGLAKAKELSFRACRVKGVEAERIGLVNRAFKDGELEKQVNSIIDEILENSFEAIVRIKKLYDKGYHTTLKKGLKIEAKADTHLESTNEQLAKFQKK